MSRCPGCGGIIGIDCFNPTECVNIGHAIEEDHIQRRERDYSSQIELLQSQLTAKETELKELREVAEKMMKALQNSDDRPGHEHNGIKAIADYVFL